MGLYTTPWHAAGYYFNPEFYYVDEEIENDREVSEGLHACISRLVPCKVRQELIMTEMIQWVNQAGFFGLEVPKVQRGKIAPTEWWKLYEKGTPNLQQIAIKIHSKKRNQLEHQKLHDLVFVKYNKMLKLRRDANVAYDPIALDEIDDSNEWLTGEMDQDRVFDDDWNLTWTLVGEAIGAGEERRTRATFSKATTSNASKKKKVDR
ncbi:uncharacterized protein LOC110932065 [Helianthus annuus]|uniref:uncharacterized protein LOC110932065 n=1 Tax=Helianthus annuus TaxID=4232 RepID=UPI000B90364A|nr:uncharacterized protein LOC110932065 [Helianthus annuus]